MTTLYLLVFTGWPSDGKSSIASVLGKWGCEVVESDVVRSELFPGIFPLDIVYPGQWEYIWEEICRRRDTALKSGRNVVIDSCAQNNCIRDKFFTIPQRLEEYFKHNSISLIRLLISLRVKRKELTRREKARGRNFRHVERIIQAMKTDYQSCIYYNYPGVRKYEFNNNTLEEQEIILGLFKKWLWA